MKLLPLLLCATLFFPSSLVLGKSKEKPVVPLKETSKVNLVWQHNNDDEVNLTKLPKIEGLNVVSPCWYVIANEYGYVIDKSQEGYVKAAHAKNYKVWPLITSSFNPTLFHKVLTDFHARRFVIDQMLEQAEKHNFDGFNLDFENIRDDDKNNLTFFVKEINTKLKEKNLKLSMDVTVPSGEPYWSNCYDRKELSKLVDYVMLMAYDQHTPTMGIPGPTAGYNWVNTKLKETLKEVPSEKLVLGIPLYMRIWETNLATGKTKGRTLSMIDANKLTEEKGALPSWKADYLPKEGLTKCSFTENNIRSTFWLENSTSLNLKTALVKDYNLAGVASWRKGFEAEDVWPVIINNLIDDKKGLAN